MIVIGGGIFIVGILLGALVGHRGNRFEGARGGYPMQANQQFRGRMMRGQTQNIPQQGAAAQALPQAQDQTAQPQTAPTPQPQAALTPTPATQTKTTK